MVGRVVISVFVQFLTFAAFLQETVGDAEGKCPYEQMKTEGNLKGRTTTNTSTICDLMKPRQGVDPQTTPCPWTIFIYRNEIEQLHAQPVVLGSSGSVDPDIFYGYLITAKKLVDGDQLGSILGHFEPQWDAIGHCCGNHSRPNMLDGSLSARVMKPNQTLLWTAPKDYIGPFVFLATMWKTARKYWFEIKSPVIHVIHRSK